MPEDTNSQDTPVEPKKRTRRRTTKTEEPAAQEASTEVKTPAKRRGRPRKKVEEVAEPAQPAQPALPEMDAAQKPAEEKSAPKRRGRPKKVDISGLPDVDAAIQAEIDRLAAAHEASLKAAKPKRKTRAKKQTEEVKVAEAAEATKVAETLVAEATSEPTDATPAPAQEAAQAEAPQTEAPQTEAPQEEVKPRRSHKKQEEAAPEASEEAAKETDAEATDESGQKEQKQRFSRSNNQNHVRVNRNNQNNKNFRKKNHNELQTSPSLSMEELLEYKVADLRAKASEFEIEYAGKRKQELALEVYAAAAKAEGFYHVVGILQIAPEGYGWIRTGNYTEGEQDCFVHQMHIKSWGLRTGDKIDGLVGPSRPGSKYPPLVKVELVNGQDPESARGRVRFKDLTPIYPNERLTMETGPQAITGRCIDLVAPIGKGQRGLIVSPPKAGKTTVLKKICNSISKNNPEAHIFCLLVDERPEEVTDMQRSIKGTVVASTFDQPADNHTMVAELVIEHAKRLVEMKEDVVVVLDSITRLARAYNLTQPTSGRILSGGVDSASIYPSKKFLGAARNIEGGGSLTIIASALVETGSKMDEVIFEEFKGTGNMELKLDRDLADRRIFPAIDPISSGTRNEDLLMDPELQPFVWGMRRILANMNSTERAANALIKGIKSTESNQDFLIRSARKSQMGQSGNDLFNMSNN